MPPGGTLFQLYRGLRSGAEALHVLSTLLAPLAAVLTGLRHLFDYLSAFPVFAGETGVRVEIYKRSP